MRDSVTVDRNVTDTDVKDDLQDDMKDESPDKNEFAEFGLKNGSTTFKIRDWKKNMNLNALGVANDTLSRVQTLASDTHQGATVTEYKYDDIILQFFTPKGSNDAWLKAMEIKGGPWATARGIKVGDSLADLKSMYPKAINNAEDKTLYTYNVDDSNVTFAVIADKVSRIKVEYNIP